MMIMLGQYWKCVEADPDDTYKPIRVDELVLITKIDADQITFVCGKDRNGTYQIDEFTKFYKFDPFGEQKREAEIAQLMREASDFAADQKAIETSMSSISVATTTELVKSNDPQSAKKQLGMAKGAIVRMQEAALEKQERLMGFLEEKKSLMMAKVDAMKDMVKKVEDVVWAINIYSGSAESLVQLRFGEPAPATEKVSIRQMRLFMDEEYVINEDDGGLDFKNIDAFDKWIADDTHPERLHWLTWAFR